MIYNLFENGLNSLDMGVEFYDKYFHTDNPFEDEQGYRHLKLAVICIHNSLEILIKYLLTKQNELLIFDNLSNPGLLEVIKLHNEFPYKNNIPLNDIVNSRDISVSTITYKEAVNRIKVFIDIKEKDSLSLENIGIIRNKIIHFGIYKLTNFYEIIGAVNNSLDFILNTLYPYFKQDKNDYYDIDKLYEKAEETLHFGRKKEHEYWSSFYSYEFETLNKILYEVIDDTEIKELLEQKKLNIRLEKEKYIEASNVKIIVFGSDMNKNLHTINYPGLNLTLFKDNEEKVLAYIDHHHNLLNDENKAIFECKKPFIIENEDFDYQYLKKQKFLPRILDIDTIKSILIKNIINS